MAKAKPTNTLAQFDTIPGYLSLLSAYEKIRKNLLLQFPSRSDWELGADSKGPKSRLLPLAGILLDPARRKRIAVQIEALHLNSLPILKLTSLPIANLTNLWEKSQQLEPALNRLKRAEAKLTSLGKLPKGRKPKHKAQEQKGESRLDRFTERDFANIINRSSRTVSAWLKKSKVQDRQDRWDKKKETIPYRMALAAVLIYRFLLGDKRDTAVAKLKRLADRKGCLPRIRDWLKEGAEPGVDIFPWKPDPSLLTEFHIKA